MKLVCVIEEDTLTPTVWRSAVAYSWSVSGLYDLTGILLVS